jgi:hypothetical protein
VTLAVYAITDATTIPAATGIRGERLRLYRHGPLAAVAGEVRGAPAATADNLRRYDGTMRRLAAALPALLPVRFGTCVAGSEELRVVLEARQQSLRRALAHVRNRVQMTMRVLGGPHEGGSPDHPAAPGRSGRTSAARSASVPAGVGAQYMHARAESARRQRDVAGFEPVRAALQRWLRDERIERHGATTSVYHLIPRTAAAGYQRTAMRTADAVGLRILVTGPWPPYAFAADW